MKRIFSLLSVVLLFVSSVNAQIENPVEWNYSANRISATEAEIVIECSIEKGWHLYSQFINEGGPIPTSFSFKKNKSFSVSGKVAEIPAAVPFFDPIFEMDISWFSDQAKFVQKIKTNTPGAIKIDGELEFMTCNDSKCLPPEWIEFSVTVPATAGAEAVVSEENIIETPADEENILTSSDEKIGNSSRSIFGIFLAGFFGGFLALIMPCIFPMIPLTVSYFTKSSEKPGAGIGKAILYGVSIIVIYVALGSIITLAFGSDALNELASNGVFNFIFFLILVIFAISFLGAFELTLPSSFVNKMDEKSDKSGFAGIFFMAFTLVLVSFSCTGPIIGTLLVETAVSGLSVGPLVGMLGFSSALAIPFTLFAIFPKWMNAMPKSGGWLNSVKVVLGFLELALALKFLSVVDLAYHWNFLDREVFLVLWIVIFALMGFYLLGKLQFSHDSPVPFVTIPRLMLSILTFAFVVYMIPGLWGAPLKAISGFLPPTPTQDFDLHTRTLGNGGAHESSGIDKKYSDLFHCPHNLDCFFDLEQGVEYAKEVGKPILLDFTGHSCVNCRKMEASVWSEGPVLDRLANDYVIISLYVDDKTELPEDEQYVSSFSGKKVRTIGNKWSDFQASTFGANSQPYYVLLDHDQELLVAPTAFDLDANKYVKFLDAGKKAFNNK